MAFIDDMRAAGHAVESTCRVLTEHGCTVAARTYRSWKQAGRPVAARTVSDAALSNVLIGLKGTPEGLYGRRKMTHFLHRQGHDAAFCTVDRLMRDLGMNGVRRGKTVRTTIPAKDGHRAKDLLNRDFAAPAPNLRWVADFTYCRTWAGFCYVAFIVDVFAQRIVGWHAATTKVTDLVYGLRCGTGSDKESRSSRVSCCTTPTRAVNTPVSGSPNTSNWPRSRHRSAPSGTPTTTP
jgi:putative transposase